MKTDKAKKARTSEQQAKERVLDARLEMTILEADIASLYREIQNGKTGIAKHRQRKKLNQLEMQAQQLHKKIAQLEYQYSLFQRHTVPKPDENLLHVAQDCAYRAQEQIEAERLKELSQLREKNDPEKDYEPER